MYFTKFKFLLISLIVLIIGMLAGYLITKVIYEQGTDCMNLSVVEQAEKEVVIEKFVPREETYQGGMEDAYLNLIKRGHASIVARGYGIRKSKTIGGKVKEIGDSSITLTVYPVSPLTDPDLDERNVIIDENTKIYKRAEKDSEQYEKEMQEFDAKMADLANNPDTEIPEPPEGFEKQEISLSELNTDNQITITAEDLIHNAKEFIASEIVLEY